VFVNKIASAIGRVEELSILPCVGARVFSQLFSPQSSPSDLLELIESDPVLTARVLSVIHQQGISFEERRFSLSRAVDKLPAELVQQAILSAGISQDNGKSAGYEKSLILYALATACCAEAIAEFVRTDIAPKLAYSAGLLHNIGNIALCQAMPKSFERIAEQAQMQKACICDIQRKFLGIDYTILGKRLAQRWHLPQQITLAVWLHHTDTDTVCKIMPEAIAAQVVHFASQIVRLAGIGHCGSYDLPLTVEQIAAALSVSVEQILDVRQKLTETVRRKSDVLGLNLSQPKDLYFESVHNTAVRLGRQNTKLSKENQKLQTAQSHFNFIREFLKSIDPTNSPVEIAENFAVRWQKFYQTGRVCLYLTGRGSWEYINAVVIEGLSQSKILSLEPPRHSPAIPEPIAAEFGIVDAHKYCSWLFEQLETDFEAGRSKLLPLLCKGRAIGAVTFELHYPGDVEQFSEQFAATSSIAGTVLDMACTCAEQQDFAEKFAQLAVEPKSPEHKAGAESEQYKQQPVDDRLFNALVEMAGGIAHELNNPLSVISGRAQLLAVSEKDAEKIQILEQIQENATRLSGIIDDLMSFAEPQSPRPMQTDVRQMLDEAVQLAALKTKSEQPNISMDIDSEAKTVYVDSAQVVSAIANIFANALESYKDGTGQVNVIANFDRADNRMKLQISDSGCGMNSETLEKANYPFFSAQQAGRKRGTGLAQACRLIRLNNGFVNIASRPGRGTTVTITLACK